MKNFIIHSLAAISGFVCLVSCSEQESLLQSENPSSANQLRIATHTREGEEPATPLASVYLFDASNKLVRTVQTNAAGDYTSASSSSVKLPEGSYTLCALNASDLDHFQIPDNPTPTSAITIAEGQTMGDLLMATATESLDDGETKDVNMTLLRKVLELSSVSISQVPDDVTGVTVSIAPFYSAVQFNGEYVDADPATVTFTLTDAGSGLWGVTPQQLCFPSNGTPTITVTFTRGEENASFAYTAESPLTANNKYNIAGTYTEPLGVTLAGAITFQPWATDATNLPFNFDHNNATTPTDPTTEPVDPPVAGQTYQDYYVVSVDATHHTAVLLSKTQETGIDTETKRDAAYAKMTKPDGVTNNWRFPSIEECQAFLSDINTPQIVYNQGYYCTDGVNNYRIKAVKADGVITLSDQTVIDGKGYLSNVYLRPVIDISY